MKLQSVDINCDLGESYGNLRVGRDEDIFPYISSCNIACGFHGGDPATILNTIELALHHEVRIGAHPGYPDLAGFGRRKMAIRPEDLRALVLYQVSALKGMVESCGGTLAYVKPHGAMYNAVIDDETEAHVIYGAIREIDPGLAVMGFAESALDDIADELGLQFIAEAFGDRRYGDNFRLLSRAFQGAELHEPAEVVQQVLSIIQTGSVQTNTGKVLEVKADSICVHGDNPSVLNILKEITNALDSLEITVSA